MNWDYSNIMKLFSDHGSGELLLAGNWGLEKESLRVSPSGQLSLSPHPQAFGDKINNPHITVDFSESQVELITPVLQSIEETHDFLCRLHSFVEESIGDEMLWPMSMPGSLPSEDQIPLADYGDHEKGREKEIYRSGLALRYGKKMQMISGIHYNFSFSDSFWEFLHGKIGQENDLRSFKDEMYLNLTRNFLKFRWLLIYLFGASPLGTEAYMSEFLTKNECVCDKAGCKRTFENPVQFATSLRMSRFGYENSYQDLLKVSYNSLESYIGEIRRALGQEIDQYTDLGIFKNGEQVQMNGNLLQSENEYYAPVRLKRIPKKNKSMLAELAEDGIEYLEFRIFDLDPFQRTGISLQQMYFIHVFLLYCCLNRLEDLTQDDMNRFSDNAQLAALFGRSEQLKLMLDDKNKVSIRGWSQELFGQLRDIATLLDSHGSSDKFQKSVAEQARKLENIEFLPSSTIVNIMNFNGDSHEGFGLDRAVQNLGERLPAAVEAC